MTIRALIVFFHEDWVGYGRRLKKDHLLQAWPKTFGEDGNTFMLSYLLPLVSKTHLSTLNLAHIVVAIYFQIIVKFIFIFYLEPFLTSVIHI